MIGDAHGSPLFSAAKVGDVRGVVAGVPGVEESGTLDSDAAAFGMDEAALPLSGIQRLEEHDPASVQAFDEVEGPLDGSGGIVKYGPGGLIVGFDGGPIFGKGEFDAGERVHVGVGDVMDELADGPAGFAVGGVELLGGKAMDGIVEFTWKIGEFTDGGKAVVVGDGFGRYESTDREARVWLRGGVGGHARELLRQTVAQPGGREPVGSVGKR